MNRKDFLKRVSLFSLGKGLSSPRPLRKGPRWGIGGEPDVETHCMRPLYLAKL
jgi:hypothetical protein